jgi:2-iminobutanoate/2-iminopropanoate deaminase
MTTRIPAPIGPYRPWVEANGFLFLSGQTPLDPTTGALVDGDVAAQTTQVLANLGAVLEAAGASWADVVKTTVFLTDMAFFDAMNAVYASVLGEVRPARSTVAVRGLPKGASVEIELVARARS